MELKQLEVFACVADHASFSKAAAKLYLTQPTVSAHIAALEREMGVKLIERTTKAVTLTEEGREMYRYARDMLSLRDSAHESMSREKSEVCGALRIGASTIPAQFYLPELISEFFKLYPKVRYDIITGDSAEVVEQLLNRKIDLGITGAQGHEAGCLYEPLAHDNLVVITPNAPPFEALHGDFPLNLLDDCRYIGRELGSGTRKETEQLLQKAGYDPARLDVIARMGHTDGIIKAVGRGMGVSIVSGHAAEDDLQLGRILKFSLKGIDMQRKLYIVRRAGGVVSTAARLFAEFSAGYYCVS